MISRSTFASIAFLVVAGTLISSAVAESTSAAGLMLQDPVLQRERQLVRQVQLALSEQGYDPGPADGIMGPLTRGALRDYQRAHGLGDDGQMTEATLESLGVEAPDRSEADRKGGGLVGTVASGGKSVGKTVAGASSAGAKKTASVVSSGAKAAAKGTAAGATTVAQATATGASKGARATAKGSTTGAKATAKGTTTAAKSTASAVETGADATVGGAKAVGQGAGKALQSTKNFLFGKDQDKVVANRVRDAFRAHPGIDPDHFGINVDDSIVTLTFKSGTSNEWNRAVAVAKRVEGVKQVYVRKPAP